MRTCQKSIGGSLIRRRYGNYWAKLLTVFSRFVRVSEYHLTAALTVFSRFVRVSEYHLTAVLTAFSGFSRVSEYHLTAVSMFDSKTRLRFVTVSQYFD